MGRRVVAGASFVLYAPVPSSKTDRRWQIRSRVCCLRLPPKQHTPFSGWDHTVPTTRVRMAAAHTVSSLHQ